MAASASSFRIFAPVLSAMLPLTLGVACANPLSSRADARSFIETGLSDVRLSSYSINQVVARTLLATGVKNTVTLEISNPNRTPVTYGISCNLGACYFLSAPPTSLQSDGTTVSFSFKLNASAEHRGVVFTITKTNQDILRAWATDTISATCDSPPSPVRNVCIGQDGSSKAFLAFTLPDAVTDDDLASVTVAWQDRTAGTAPITVTLPKADPSLLASVSPDPLLGIASATKRYFSPAIAAGHACAFVVYLTDSGGQISTTKTVGADGISYSLGYDPNGGSGTAPGTAIYAYGDQATAGSGGGLIKSGGFFGGWNTQADGMGTSYAAGDVILMNQGSLTLYARWINTITENGLTFTVSGTTVTDSQGVVYTVTGGTIALDDYNTCSGNVTIPASIGGYPVTTLPYSAFRDNKVLTGITLPEGITSISSSCFNTCWYLEYAILPSTVALIDSNAFRQAGLKSINIPAGVTAIAMSAFESTPLTAVTLPAGLTSLGFGAFRYCDQLTTVTVKATTPPAMNTQVFYTDNINRDLKILIPAASLSAYQTAANWSTYAALMVGY